MDFGEKMREILDNKGLTQKEFAKEIKMNYAHANKFFTGRKPNMEFILKVAQRFPEVDLNWLLLPQEQHNSVDRVQESNANYNRPQAIKYISDIENKLEELKDYLSQS